MTDPATETQQESLEDGQIRVRRALISVSDKTGVADFAKGLAALKQEEATCEMLRVIGSSPTDVRPVFATIVRSAARLCGGV